MMLEIQKYLLTHTFGQLRSEYGIQTHVDRSVGHKFSFSPAYDYYAVSPPFDKEIPGLILSNGSSLFEKQIDGSFDHICPSSTVVISKSCYNDFVKIDRLDNLINVHFDQILNKWDCAVDGEPDGWAHCSGLTYKDLLTTDIKYSYNIKFNDLTSKLNPNVTYSFDFRDRGDAKLCFLAATDKFNNKLLNLNDHNIGIFKLKHQSMM